MSEFNKFKVAGSTESHTLCHEELFEGITSSKLLPQATMPQGRLKRSTLSDVRSRLGDLLILSFFYNFHKLIIPTNNHLAILISCPFTPKMTLHCNHWITYKTHWGFCCTVVITKVTTVGYNQWMTGGAMRSAFSRSSQRRISKLPIFINNDNGYDLRGRCFRKYFILETCR